MKYKKIYSILTTLVFASIFFFSCNIITGNSGSNNQNPNNQQTTTDQKEDSSEKPENTSNGKNLSSVDFAKELTIGWNLGNTFDADSETAWGMPETTKEMLHAVKAAGFKTIRIPVSWSKHVSGSNYQIDSKWMSRVTEVVDWALEEGFYVIINVHHDNYKAGSNFTGFAISTSSEDQTKSKKYLQSVWTQIATNFKDYGNKLIFEVLNEPRRKDESNEWDFSSTSDCKPYCDIITSYEHVCINAIRAVQGNEARYIMVPGYAGSGASQTMLKAYTLPEDTAKDKLLLSVHAYSPFNFAMSNPDSTFDSDDEEALTSLFSFLKTNYTDEGIGVVMGEASASNKGNDAERIKWAKDYFAKAKESGIPVVLWDNMVETVDGYEGDNKNEYNGEHHGWLHRKSGKWFFPEIIKAMMDTVGITDYSIPEYVIPTPENIGWDESKAKNVQVTNMGEANWDGAFNKMSKESFVNAKNGSILKISFGTPTNSCEFVDSSWDYRFNSSSAETLVDGNDLYIILSNAEASKWKTTDISIVGGNLNVTAVKFQE